jgi:asparagine N-glycosylation enzyme membrane subunit Stt3
VPLNVDVIRPAILESGSITAMILVEYQPTSPGTVQVPATVKASLDAVLPNGRRVVVSETADPTSERTTTLEVTATVLP